MAVLRDPEARAAMAVIVLWLVGVTLSGCGASALERHTMAAGILHAVADESAQIIEADAQRAADDAVAPCEAGEAPRETCEAALTEAMRPRRRAAAVQRLYAAAVDGYVLAVLTAARDESPDLSLAVRALGRVLAVYDELRALLGEYGVPLPDPGPLVRGLLGGAS